MPRLIQVRRCRIAGQGLLEYKCLYTVLFINTQSIRPARASDSELQVLMSAFNFFLMRLGNLSGSLQILHNLS